jgi:hypothetical protein
MALEIIWTHQADNGLQKVIDYLEQDWTPKEILKLAENINQVTNQIKFSPDLYPKSGTYKDLHIVVIDKNNYLV